MKDVLDFLLFAGAGVGAVWALRSWFRYHAAVKTEKLMRLWGSTEGWR